MHIFENSLKIPKTGIAIHLDSDRGEQLAVGLVGVFSTSSKTRKSCWGEIGRKALQGPHFNLCIPVLLAYNAAFPNFYTYGRIAAIPYLDFLDILARTKKILRKYMLLPRYRKSSETPDFSLCILAVICSMGK